MGIRVKATAPGYYVHYREIGAQFDIAKESDMGDWMEKVKGGGKSKPDTDPDADGGNSGETNSDVI
ncbi:hypothetical protein [Pandoraea sputorum]|uniref:hypothetical protein n=1 Tax=Pandoraea sputorum TaxID=93222 RepID=UPI0012401BA3|nr:hypothetical protein [Pandoraea sputorum]VVE77397.1 hypothetical protein PSP31120_01271 [Pandoraea sputorum]